MALTTLSDLKPLPQWVCFNRDKIPFTPSTGRAAKADDPTTWGNYDQAARAYKLQPGRYAGVGFEFVKGQGITGVDLDHCIDDAGNLSPFARRVVELLNSYTEFSPSGRGLHIFVHGSIPASLKDDQGENRIEMYDEGRYFTITARHFVGTPATIEDRQAELDQLYQEIQAQRQQARDLRRQARQLTRSGAAQTTNGGDTAYGLAALQDECDELATTGEGRRNHQLNDAAYALGRLVAGGELARATVERELFAAAARTGLDDREIEKTMQSGLEAGLKEPRSRPASTYTTNIHPPVPPAIPAAPETTAPGLVEAHLCAFDADDAGNGDAMYYLYGQEFLWCGSRGWFVYCGTHWKLDSEAAEVRKAAVETLRARRHAAVNLEKEAIVKCTKADEGKVNGCINRFKTLVNIGIEAFDSNPDVLNCKNGVVCLRDGSIEPHARSQRFTYCIPVEYEATEYPEWLDYLNGVVGGGQEVIDYLQMALGYSCTGHTREEVLFYLYGPTRSGKGTLAEIYMNLLPDPLSTGVDFNSFTAKREGDVNNFDLAPLKPSRLIFASESQRHQSLNPAKIKAITGGDPIRASFKHKDFFSYRPQFKVWMLSNWPVNGDPEDDALWGRVRVIEFPNSYLGKEDKAKKARLKSPEAQRGILYWTVQGAIKWYQLGAAGLKTPQSVVESTNKQRAELDYVQQWLESCCEDDSEGWTSNEEVAVSYMHWCQNNNVQYPKGPKALAQSLKAKGYQTGVQRWIGQKNVKGVAGLRLQENPSDSLYSNGSNERFPGSSHRKKDTEKPGITRYESLEPLKSTSEEGINPPVEPGQQSSDSGDASLERIARTSPSAAIEYEEIII